MQELTTFNFEITSLQQAMEYSKMIASSDLAPKDYKGKPGNVLIAIQCGMEIGLKPMQAIQNIAVINGRPAVWGDALQALVLASPLCEYIREKIVNDVAYCTVKRKNDEEQTYKFSKDDAKKANLLGKPGPWTQYPDRMLQMRARGFALRDKFADVLKGIALVEEVQDYQVIQAKNADSSPVLKTLLENKTKKEVIDVSTGNINSEPVIEDLKPRIKTMISKFSGVGVGVEHLEGMLGYSVDEINSEDISTLQGIYKSIKDGFSNKEDHFDFGGHEGIEEDDKK